MDRVALVMVKTSAVIAIFGFCSIVPAEDLTFGAEEAVEIVNYTDTVMEVFVSRDGQFLFFNNSNEAPNTNLHYATRIDDLHFQYMGEVGGVNTAALEGVPSMDTVGNFFYTETGSYFQDFISIYGGLFSAGTVAGAGPRGQHLTLRQNGDIDMDSQVSADGNTLYFARATFPNWNGGPPSESDLWVAVRYAGEFHVAEDSEYIMQNINTDLLEYGAATSNNDLELYFTRLNLSGPVFETYVAQRANKSEPFGLPQLISQITGFSEAPTITGGCDRLYFHKLVGGLFQVYTVEIMRAGVVDADQDGLLDAVETNSMAYIDPTDTGTDPKNPDTDHDGLFDGWEVTRSLDPTSADDNTVDNDEGTGDGLTLLEEFQYETDPGLADSDGDGVSDGNEVYSFGTNPANADSDGDGVNDGTEVNLDSDPADAASLPSLMSLWVQFNAAGLELGSMDQPFNSLAEGILCVTEGGTVRIRGDTGVPNTDYVVRLTKAVRIEAVGGTVRIGTPYPVLLRSQ